MSGIYQISDELWAGIQQDEGRPSLEQLLPLKQLLAAALQHSERLHTLQQLMPLLKPLSFSPETPLLLLHQLQTLLPGCPQG